MGTPLVPMVKNPPCTAGDVGSIPCLGTESPPASEKLSPCTAMTEPVCSGADVTQPESQPQRKIPHNAARPDAAQTEEAVKKLKKKKKKRI